MSLHINKQLTKNASLAHAKNAGNRNEVQVKVNSEPHATLNEYEPSRPRAGLTLSNSRDYGNAPRIRVARTATPPLTPRNRGARTELMRSKSHSISSQVGDLDDDDCINIRTDGELLDTAEEINTEDVSRKTKDHSLNSKISENDFDKKRTNVRRSPHRQNEKLRSEDLSAERPSEKQTVKRQRSPTESPPKSNDKLVDARELLNRKKAAKLSDNRTKSRSRERSWSTSPPRRRRDYDRDNQRYRDDRDNRRVTREEEREHATRRVGREDRRERKCTRERDTYSTKRRGDDRTSRRDLDSRDNRKRDSSGEPPSSRIPLEKPFRNKVNEWESSRTSKVNNLSEGRKVGMDSSVKRRDLEESSKRSGLVSHVVARPQEPEDSVDTPVPSVVKITPRPRRPPSQQASSNLIIKAISEANKSLANIPQRPDSTQEDAREVEHNSSKHVNHSDAVRALNTAIRYIKQTDQSNSDVAVLTKWRNLALSALNDS
ncbi:hypothetical protein J6590_008663 [Homalodisca vitripennis]|nr:hypothetical protein J6590_008663 [Homalodisca vitripennis]